MWKFTELKPGEPERDPHEAEFFRLNAPTEAVVREFVQNSMDAKLPGDEPVTVRVLFGKADSEKASPYIDKLKKHLEASEISFDCNSRNDVPFLLLEDSGTTGLDGETMEAGIRPTGRSNFYNFWWCEGKSKKTGKDAGRWGLGKTTFHLVSQIRTFLGMTIRQDDGRALCMGKSLLKTHKIGNNFYHYYGYYLDRGSRPFSDAASIEEFKDAFNINRNSVTGFSIVIPFPSDDIDFKSALESVIIHYSFAILTGMLRIRLEYENNHPLKISDDNLLSIAMSQNWEGTPWENTDVRKLLEFMESSINNPEVIMVTPGNPDKPEISRESFGEDVDSLIQKFNAGKLLSFKVPVRIKKAGKTSNDSFFTVNLKKSEGLKNAKEFYTRSGITISSITTLKGRPVYALLVAEDNIISEFLGDCETPAHTEWNERSEGFKDKYENAARMLRFVKNSMKNIVSILDLPPAERQVNFLKDIFAIPYKQEKEEEEPDVPETPEIVSESEPVPTIKGRPAIFQIHKIQNGFKVAGADELKKDGVYSMPVAAVIKAAYDVRKGNPFAQYEKFDFDFADNNFVFKEENCSIVERKENIIKLNIEKADFSLSVKGFASSRDLVVSVVEKRTGEENETQI